MLIYSLDFQFWSAVKLNQQKVPCSSESSNNFLFLLMYVLKSRSANLDKLIIFQPGNVRFGVAEGNAGQHRFGFYQKGYIGRMALDLWLWLTDGHDIFSLNGTVTEPGET